MEGWTFREIANVVINNEEVGGGLIEYADIERPDSDISLQQLFQDYLFADYAGQRVVICAKKGQIEITVI